MPSTATITAFYSFTANTKARATHVTNNFDIFRGHIIAVDPNTATAAPSLTYDLGSDDHRWRNVYADRLYLSAIASPTISSGVGGFAVSNKISNQDISTATSFHVANSTLTIQTIGRPVEVGLKVIDATFTAQNGFSVSPNTSGAWKIEIWLLRNGVTVSVQALSYVGDLNIAVPATAISFFDFASAGSNVYSIDAASINTLFANMQNVQLYAIER